MRVLGIYKILNTITGKFYIGKSSNNVKHRWNVHKFLLRKNEHKNIYLQNAWNKYGEEAFEFSILEICTKENITEREQYWIDFLGACDRELGYNINPNAESSLGKIFRQETKDKIGAANKGKIRTYEAKARMSTAGLKRAEQGVSIETRLRISKGRKGKSNPINAILSSALKHRKPDKWPHPLGVKCWCGECLEKRRAYARDYARAKRGNEIVGTEF